jgi:hypothetical protein
VGAGPEVGKAPLACFPCRLSVEVQAVGTGNWRLRDPPGRHWRAGDGSAEPSRVVDAAPWAEQTWRIEPLGRSRRVRVRDAEELEAAAGLPALDWGRLGHDGQLGVAMIDLQDFHGAVGDPEMPERHPRAINVPRWNRAGRTWRCFWQSGAACPFGGALLTLNDLRTPVQFTVQLLPFAG